MNTLLGLIIAIIFGFCVPPTMGQIKGSPKIESRQESGCDFTRYKPLRDSHILMNGVLRRGEPKYPAAALAVRASGKVVVRILVNRRGDVVYACVVEGNPLLETASLKAARQWKFKRNFGFIHFRPKQRYLEEEIDFNFTLPH